MTTNEERYGREVSSDELLNAYNKAFILRGCSGCPTDEQVRNVLNGVWVYTHDGMSDNQRMKMRKSDGYSSYIDSMGYSI